MASPMELLLQRKGLLHDMPTHRLEQLQGQAMGLFLASDRHADYTLNDFASSILAPIHLNQFRLYRDANERPIGWVSWAYMSDANAQGFMAGDFDFTVDTWQSGEHLWFIDYIAPFGHALKMASDLKYNVFPDQVAFAPDLEGPNGTKRIRKFFGGNVVGADTSERNDDFIETVAR